MDLIVTHNNADFDALGAAVAAHKLYKDSKILLPGSQEQAVRRFLSLARDEINIETEKTCNFDQINRLILVDTRHRSRIGLARNLLERNVDVHIYDHHPRMPGDIKGEIDVHEEVGATITILINMLKGKKRFPLTPLEATIMLLGIYEETGSLTYRSTTRKDVDIVSFLLGKGASLQAVSSYLNRQLSEGELAFLVELINKSKTYLVNGINVALTEGEVTEFVGELGTIVHKLEEVENFPVLFVFFKTGTKVRILARSKEPKVDVNKILQKLGGGGHSTAATARINSTSINEVKERVLGLLKTMIKVKIYARDVMSRPVKTIPINMTIKRAKEIFDKLKVKGCPCIEKGKLRGIITMGDIKKALRHNFGHSKVTGYMRPKVITVSKNTPLHIIQKIMFEKNIGRLPVIQRGKLVGIVTRTDVLKKVYGDLFKGMYVKRTNKAKTKNIVLNLHKKMRALLPKQIMKLLKRIGKLAEDKGYSSFVVGGFIRDILLGVKNFDIDIVLEGNAVEFGSILARELGGTLVVHKKFGTATLVMDWPKGLKRPKLASPKFKIDLATARRERYEKPAALPTVEFSSLKDDLSRRDFSINAMAVSLNRNTFGQLIDFFDGLKDLRSKRIRVLHEASFIDDPTRIFRAVRFEQRFSFKIDTYTEKLIRDAVREKMFRKTENQRIRDEIILILKEDSPLKALRRMKALHELRFIHKGIVLNKRIEEFFERCFDNYICYQENRSKKRNLDLYVMYLMALTDKLDARGLSDLCDKFVFKRGDRIRVVSYKKNCKIVLNKLSAAKGLPPSKIYKILEPLSYETILVIAARANRTKVRKRISNFLGTYNKTRIKLRGDDLKECGIKEGPHFKKILGKLLYAKLDGKIKTKREEMVYLRKMCNKKMFQHTLTVSK